MDAGDQPLVADEQQRHPGGLVDATALGFDDPVFDLIAHAQAVPPANGVGLAHQLDGVRKGPAVQRNGRSVLEANHDDLGFDRHLVAPEGHAHDRVHDLDSVVEVLEILGFVRRTEDIRIGRVRLLGAHAIGEPGARHILRHLPASAELVDEALIEPRLVDPKIGIDEQPVPIKPLDVVSLERAAIAPDMDVVFFHGSDEHGAGHGAPQRRRVEVRQARGRDVECAGLQRRHAFRHELLATVDQARLLGAVLQGAAGNLTVIGLVGLAEVRSIRERHRAVAAHPVEGGARIEAAGKRNTHLLAGGKGLDDGGHCSTSSIASRLGPSIMMARAAPT